MLLTGMEYEWVGLVHCQKYVTVFTNAPKLSKLCHLTPTVCKMYVICP